MSRSWQTELVRAGIDADPTHGAVAPPLVLSANFSFAGEKASTTCRLSRMRSMKYLYKLSAVSSKPGISALAGPRTRSTNATARAPAASAVA